jgi:precorrin-4/cobalt-precorrin-4 C11-methyltransferase
MPPGEELAAYAATGATLVLHLAVQRIAELGPAAAEHYGPDGPVAWSPGPAATTSWCCAARSPTSPAGRARGAADGGGRRRPGARAAQFPDSHLYSTTRCRY